MYLQKQLQAVPIAIVENGDIINIDIPNGKLELAVSDDEITRRKAALKPFKSNVTGYLKNTLFTYPLLQWVLSKHLKTNTRLSFNTPTRGDRVICMLYDFMEARERLS